MDIGGSAGGGIMLALAAGLWLAYLVPSWLRNREYVATERNAVRLQQTLRVLAETAEVPAAVRAETTARSVAAHQRTLRQQRAIEDAAARAREVAAARTAARQLAAVQPAIAAVVAVRSRAALRLRRTRAVTSVVLLGALAIVVAQGVLMATTGIAPAAPFVLGLGGAVVVSSLAMLGRLGAVSRARAAVGVVQPAAAKRRTSLDPYEQQAAPAVPRRDWTPVPVPKPLYLSRTSIEQPVFDVRSAVADLQAAAARSDSALRAAQAAPEVVPFLRKVEPVNPPAASAPTSRFARMGIVDADEQSAPDVDAMLRRRRAAG
ncbi:hypothetical protein EYE40_09115 [Glaciihabitans arcticus]|uniref:Large exoprotein n=1 Tax=Glaciihabitans arcticus TaxID=2668039 RepID=A0A4Q9GTN3_9MICO|nr:hypothetical protein [Glaciihabitans arcticus]TBN57534.1 hypothetical protein EYE40_09115 [Glaciihabitans arcticus]